MTENEMREIGEMAVYLDENCAGLFALGYANPLPIVDFVAKLYSAGCRIVKDGDVVLTSEEYNKFQRQLRYKTEESAFMTRNLEVLDKDIARLEEELKQARKEAGRRLTDFLLGAAAEIIQEIALQQKKIEGESDGTRD